MPALLPVKKLDQLIDALSEEDRVTLITKKIRELPFEVMYQVFQVELTNSNVIKLLNSHIYPQASIPLQIQSSQNVDIASILDSLAEYCRRKKSQGN
jgi:hypothetical protein